MGLVVMVSQAPLALRDRIVEVAYDRGDRVVNLGVNACEQLAADRKAEQDSGDLVLRGLEQVNVTTAGLERLAVPVAAFGQGVV